MNWDNYCKIKEIFLKNKVKPLIGVIPHNEDKELLNYPMCDFNFWKELENLKYNEGWSVALHGYNHVYATDNPGILNINRQSEFAGLPRHVQNLKIMLGKKIFAENEIEIDAFMAPSHSYDKTTIECLKDNGIGVVTDGYALFPYYDDGVLFIPQLSAKPRKMPFGVFTWCLHLNNMSDKSIKDLEVFIEKNHKDITDISKAKEYVIGIFNYRIQSFLIKKLLASARRLRALNQRLSSKSIK